MLDPRDFVLGLSGVVADGVVVDAAKAVLAVASPSPFWDGVSMAVPFGAGSWTAISMDVGHVERQLDFF